MKAPCANAVTPPYPGFREPAKLMALESKGELTVGIITWLMAGLTLGGTVYALDAGQFPGGLTWAALAGCGGALLGGTIFALAARRGAASPDLTGVLTAIAGAGLMLALTEKLSPAQDPVDWAEEEPAN